MADGAFTTDLAAPRSNMDWSLTKTGLDNQYDYLDSLQKMGQAALSQSYARASDFKTRQAQRQDEIRPLIAQRVAQGDYAGAQQQALGVGDNDMAQRISDLSDADTKTAAAHASAVASAASILRSRPVEQRQDVFNAIVPGLRSAGLSDAEIEAGRQHIADNGWSDDVLDGYVDTHQSVKDLAEQQARDRAQTETERHNRWDENKVQWVTPPPGGYVQGVRADGTMLGQPAGAPSPSPTSTPPTPGVVGSGIDRSGASPPVSVRNNNPGALRYDGRSQWQGMVGTPQPGQFVQFDNQADGQRAQIINLQNQARLHGINTLSALTQRYAPAGDGNDPQAYAATVGRTLGIDPNAPINLADPQVASRVAAAMAQVEAGGSPSQARSGSPMATGSAPPPGQLVDGRIYGPPKQPEAPSGYRWANDGSRQEPIPGGPADPTGNKPGPANGQADPTIDFLAKTYMQSHQLPPLGMGKQAAAMRQAVFARVAVLAQQMGKTPEELGLAGADFKSTSQSLSAVEKQQAFVSTAEQTTLDNLKIWENAASQLPGQTRYPLVNSMVQFGAKHLGNTDVHPAEDALETVSNEYAKVMSGNASGSGPTSDSARAHARAMLSNADSPQARAKVIQTLTAEMRNRSAELESQRQDLRRRVVQGGNSSSSIPPGAIAMLRSQPNTRAAFDQKYGAGAASHVLGW